MPPISLKTLAYTCCPAALHPFFKRIEASAIGSRLAKGVFWSMAGSVISRGLMFCATVLVARMLGKTVYGELGMIQSTVGMFGIFAGFGLSLTATKHVAEFRESDPRRAGRIIGLSWLVASVTGGLMALALLIFAPWLAENTINAPHLTNVLRISALILFINALNGAQTGALSGFEAFKTIAHVNLLVGLLSFPVMVLGAYYWGLTGAVWALAINLCFNWLWNHLALRKEANKYQVPLTFNGSAKELPILWNFALPATLSGIMVTPANWICRAMLTNQPNGYDEMGILTAALLFQNLLAFAGNMLSAPLLSMVSSAGMNVSQKLGTVNILSTWILGVVVAIPLLCFSEGAMVLFGRDYTTRSFQITFSLVVFCTTVIMYKAGLTRVLAARSLLWWGFFSNTFWAVTLISSTYLLVKWGAVGLAASITIAYLLNTLILLPLYYSRNLVPKGTLFSLESGLIWAVVIVLVFLNIADASSVLRGIFLVPSLIIVFFSFKRIMQRAQ